MAVVEQSNAFIANVGDSRAYRFIAAESSFRQLTKDHSLVEELVSSGQLTNEQAAFYPLRNVITRAIGTASDIKIDMFECEWNEGDYLLLCSDGLTLHVKDSELREMLLSGEHPQKLCDKMVNLALERGGKDNVTVVIIKKTDAGGGQR